jgi:hypothetical protein
MLGSSEKLTLITVPIDLRKETDPAFKTCFLVSEIPLNWQSPDIQKFWIKSPGAIVRSLAKATEF